MVETTALEDDEKAEIREHLADFAALEVEEDADLLPYLYEEYVMDGHVEVRFFAAGGDGLDLGPVEQIRFEVIVSKDAWDEDLSAYNSGNLREGGSKYEVLADELETLVEDVTGSRPTFIADKSSGNFTATVEV